MTRHSNIGESVPQIPPSDVLRAIREQLAEAGAAKKCHGCGCLHEVVQALERTEIGKTELAAALDEAHKVFAPRAYDCLGCQVCYPAIAANAFVDACPVTGESLALCPTDAPVERQGWPPLPGDYKVVRFAAAVAVCTLSSAELSGSLAKKAPEGLAIVGTLQTENLGIERLIRNVLANPNIRFLVLCGPDVRQAVGHLPGQSLASLFDGGIDDGGRIRGALGRRPVLKNVRPEQVKAFLAQVELTSLVGEEREEVVLAQIETCAARNPGPCEGGAANCGIEVVRAAEPDRFMSDPAGFLVVYPDALRERLVVEHYTNAGVLNRVIEGETSTAICATVINLGLMNRLDHAAYLGRELCRAERSLQTGERYVQDRAPGC